jgi:hypothetical protein
VSHEGNNNNTKYEDTSSDSDSADNEPHMDTQTPETPLTVSFSQRTKTDIKIQPQILKFPPEITIKIFLYLNPKDLCRTSQVCRSWSTLAKDGQLWKKLFPVRWIFRNDWRFGVPRDDEVCDCNCSGSFGPLEEDFETLELRR